MRESSPPTLAEGDYVTHITGDAGLCNLPLGWKAYWYCSGLTDAREEARTRLAPHLSASRTDDAFSRASASDRRSRARPILTDCSAGVGPLAGFRVDSFYIANPVDVVLEALMSSGWSSRPHQPIRALEA